METKIQDAITRLLKSAVSQTSNADAALKFTQAALNLAHTQQVLKLAK